MKWGSLTFSPQWRRCLEKSDGSGICRIVPQLWSPRWNCPRIPSELAKQLAHSNFQSGSSPTGSLERDGYRSFILTLGNNARRAGPSASSCWSLDSSLNSPRPPPATWKVWTFLFPFLLCGSLSHQFWNSLVSPTTISPQQGESHTQATVQTEV